MIRIVRAAVATAAAATVLTAGMSAASADATGPGHYCSKYDGVGVREQPDGKARDNLAENQTFQVDRVANDRWVYGYKIVNGIHGYVLSDSLVAC